MWGESPPAFPLFFYVVFITASYFLKDLFLFLFITLAIFERKYNERFRMGKSQKANL